MATQARTGLDLLDNSSPSTTTWVERLFMTLLSYSIVLAPIAFIVIATRFRLFPKSVTSNAVIRWFVYGSTEAPRAEPKLQTQEQFSGGDDGNRLLLNEKDNKLNHSNDNKRAEQQNKYSGVVVEFLCCLIGLQISYLIWGLLQEKVMTTNYRVNEMKNPSNNLSLLAHPIQPYNSSNSNSNLKTTTTTTISFHDSQFLVFINRLVAFILAILALVYTRHRQAKLYMNRFENGVGSTFSLSRLIAERFSHKPSAPLYKYLYSSISNILSSWCQYEALKYVNFPTQCLSKSCKLIPTMLMSKLLNGKRYQYIDYFCAILLAFGMFIFMSNQPLDQKHSPHFVDNSKTFQQQQQQQQHGNPSATSQDHLLSHINDNNKNSLLLSGLIILTFYLTFDSFTSNWQQKLYDQYDISNWQMMAAINFYSILLTLTSLHHLGNLRPAFGLLASSKDLMRDCLVMSIMSSVGQMFVYYTIKRFGSVVFAVIMTLRQLFSILLSCAIYKHQLSFGSSLGLVIVFSVAGFHVWHKSRRGRAGKQRSAELSTTTTGNQFGGSLSRFNSNNKSNGSVRANGS